MGKKDISLAGYFADKSRYADLLDVYVFGGERVVRPEDIHEEDGRVAGSLPKSGQRSKRVYVEKYRDMVRRVVLGADVVIVGLEHQDKVHYAMPARVLVEDAMQYDRQIRELRKKHRRLGDVYGAEYIGGFSKTDRLRPVLTIVVYYGAEPWEGPKDLHGMMELERIPEAMRKRINNYPIHILEVRNYPDVDKFQSDVREVFGFMQYAEDKEAAKRFVEEHRERFEHMEEDAYDLITVLTNSEVLRENKRQYQKKGGNVDMCGAMRGWHEDGVQEGLQKGVAEGVLIALGEIAVVPEKLSQRIIEEKDLAILRQWLRLAVKADSIEGFEREI